MSDELIDAVGSTVYDNLAPEYLLLTTQQGELARDVITTVLEFLAREAEKEPDALEVGGDVGGFQNSYFNAGDVCASWLRAMAKEVGE